MSFETFKRQRAPLTLEAAVTIQKRGTISLNAPAYSALGDPHTVEFLWDHEQRLMGLRKVDVSTDHGYAVRALGKSGRTFLISGAAFTTYYGIETDVARRYIGQMDDDMLVLDLKEPGTEVTSNRNQPKRQATLELS